MSLTVAVQMDPLDTINIEGDSTLFTRHDWVELAWALMDPIIQVWSLSKPKNFPNYEPASWGPREADEFIQKDGRRWRRP